MYAFKPVQSLLILPLICLLITGCCKEEIRMLSPELQSWQPYTSSSDRIYFENDNGDVDTFFIGIVNFDDDVRLPQESRSRCDNVFQSEQIGFEPLSSSDVYQLGQEVRLKIRVWEPVVQIGLSNFTSGDYYYLPADAEKSSSNITYYQSYTLRGTAYDHVLELENEVVTGNEGLAKAYFARDFGIIGYEDIAGGIWSIQ